MSVDTKGSELDILKRFDLDKYRPTIVTVEHHHRADQKQKLNSPFRAHGYKDAASCYFVCEKTVLTGSD